MTNKKTVRILKATKNAILTKCFYELLALGYFGVDSMNSFKSLIPKEKYFEVPEKALGKKGTQIFDALKELIDAYPSPLMDTDGTPILKNDDFVFDELDGKFFRQKLNKLEQLSPGIFQKIQEIIATPGYYRFTFSEEMILYEFLSEGWCFIGKEKEYLKDGSKLGTIYTFSK